MVDLATFRTFPRASPSRRSDALVAERPVPVENGALPGAALPARFAQELRAQRRAARTGMRQSESWAESDIAQPEPEPSGLAPAPAELSEALLPAAEHAELSPPDAAPHRLDDVPLPPIQDPTAVHVAPPAVTLHEAEMRLTELPGPLQPDRAEAAPPDAPPILSVQDYYASDSLDLDYQLLGLANPLVVTVTGRLGDTTPAPLTIGQTGIYRPDGFRPAPWSGLAYDVSPDGRTGLVLGTRILTARGEIPVEDLVPGDSALALRGPALLPIVWIGRSIAAPPPVEIAADAFGPGRPGKTLRVGADHPIFIQTIPVPARDLVNGGTIRTLETETAELFHIDVGFAEVLLAEGVPLSSGCR